MNDPNKAFYDSLLKAQAPAPPPPGTRPDSAAAVLGGDLMVALSNAGLQLWTGNLSQTEWAAAMAAANAPDYEDA